MSDKLEHSYLIKYKRITDLQPDPFLWGAMGDLDDAPRFKTLEAAKARVRAVFFDDRPNRALFNVVIHCMNTSYHTILLQETFDQWLAEENSRSAWPAGRRTTTRVRLPATQGSRSAGQPAGTTVRAATRNDYRRAR